VLDELRLGDRFVLVTHENPDGDALGSLVAKHRVLSALGKDSVMLMSADEFPLPYEYRFFDLDGMQSQAARGRRGAARRSSWTAATSTATRGRSVKGDGCTSSTSTTITTTRASARSTTWWRTPPARRRSCGTSCAGLGVEPTQEIADALYVGLVTDTGKFMYENTGTRAHVMAAELIEAGVDVHGIYRRLYEGMPYSKLELLGRALANVRRYDDGRPDLHHLTRDDFRWPGRRTATPRASSTTCAPSRDEGRGAGPRAGRRGRDGPQEGVAARDRRRRRRLGHRARGRRRRPPPGAGFATTLSDEDLVAFLRAEVAAQL
jgi:phosphoesterase RecJ-like protein